MLYPRWWSTLRAALVCAGLWCAGASSHAQSVWEPVSDARLEEMRGGFELSPGLAVSFGFLRSVSINGELVSQTRFTLNDLAHISADEARSVLDAFSNGLSGASVVQNSLSNQRIQTLTEINAGVNSLGNLRTLFVQGALHDALVGAVGVHP